MNTSKPQFPWLYLLLAYGLAWIFWIPVALTRQDYQTSPILLAIVFLGAFAHAFLRSRGFVTAEDVKAVAPLVLRHRLILSFEAEAEEIKSDQLVKDLLSHVEVP